VRYVILTIFCFRTSRLPQVVPFASLAFIRNVLLQVPVQGVLDYEKGKIFVKAGFISLFPWLLAGPILTSLRAGCKVILFSEGNLFCSLSRKMTSFRQPENGILL